MKRLVIDIATKRIIYFTENVNEHLVEVEKTIIYDYIGEWPEECRLENCWNFRLEGNKIVDTSPVKKEESKELIEHNRKQAINFLIDKINRNRNTLFSKCVGGDIIRLRMFKIKDVGEQLAKAKYICYKEYKN